MKQKEYNHVHSLYTAQNRIFLEEQFFCHDKQHELSGLWENVILTKIILSTDGPSGCARGDTWCQMGVWHALGEGPYLPVLLV